MLSNMRKQFQFNTIKPRPLSSVAVDDVELANSEKASLVKDIPLSRQIISDLEYGVGNRPSLPSCFDDDDFWKTGQVDTAVDMRRSKWDDLADACNPNAVTPPEQPTVEPEVEVEKTE